MVLIIGIPVIAFIVTFFTCKLRARYGFWKSVWGAIVGLSIGVMASLFLAFLLMETLPYHKVPTATHPLKSIQDVSTTHGAFFLGSGVVSGDPSFFYYEQQDDGSFVLQSVAAEDATVVESSGTPRVVDEHLAIDSGWTWLTFSGTFGHKRVVFYVPPGSITTNFTLDAK